MCHKSKCPRLVTGYAIIGQSGNHSKMPRPDSTLYGKQHTQTTQYIKQQDRRDRQIFHTGESEYADIQLHKITEPNKQRIEYEPKFPSHRNNRGKTVPDVGHKILYLQYNLAPTVRIEKPNDSDNTYKDSNIEPHRSQYIHHPCFDRRILIQKLTERLHLNHEYRKRKHCEHYRIGETIGNHRSQYFRK